MSNERSRGRALIAAILATAVAGLARTAIPPWIVERTPLLPFLFSVLFSAWLGGFWPGVLATTLGGAAGTYFAVLPIGRLVQLDPGEWLRILLFLTTGVAVSAACEALIRAHDRSERARRALRDSEAQLAATLEQIPLGVGVMDMSGRWTLRNAHMAMFVPYVIPSHDPARQRRWRAYDTDGRPIPAQDWPGARALRGEQSTAGLDMIFTADNGQEIWTHVNAAPFLNEEGTIVGVVATIQDVTMQKRAEQRLRASEAGLVAETDALTRLSDASSRLWRMPGLKEGLDETLAASIQLLGADMGNLQVLDRVGGSLHIAVQRGFRPEFLDFFREVTVDDNSACARALRSHERIVVEDVETDVPFAPLRPIAWAAGFRAVQSTPLIGRDGTPLGMLSTHWRAPHRPAPQDLRVLDLYARQAADFIERCGIDSALRESEERFHHMADSAPVLIWMSGVDKRCTWFNQRWLEFVGRSMEKEVGDGWLENLHRDDLDRCIRTYAAAFDARESFAMEYRLRRHDGEYRWILDTGTPLFGWGHEFTGYIGSCLDITERRQAEEALKEADRRKDEFLAVLAHELRNPLAPIRSAAHLLNLKGSSDPGLKRPIEMIEHQVTHMARLVDDLLDVSRIASGMVRLQLEPVDLDEVVRGAIEACRDDIESRSHRLRVRLETSRWVNGDRDRLTQIFVNLISNAAKYTPPPGVIDIRAHADGEVALVAVKDNGRGIAREKLAEVFELFMQVDRSIEGRGGLGIGLTLARRLAELHGGAIEARSDGLGRGSTFLVRLPIFSGMRAPTRTPRPEKTAEPRRVLVVDDNSDAAEGLALVLEMAGHVTRVAFDGEAALASAARFLPEIAFLDIGMPKLNGYELARRLRSLEWGKSIYLVALTGWGQESDQHRAREAGFDTLIVKPAAPESIVRLMAGINGHRAAPVA